MANLSRNIRKPRHILANTGKFGRLVPFSYHHVFAGESQHNIKSSLNFQSVPISTRLAGATVDVWYYYVPHRLVWSDFPNWVMGDGSYTTPVTHAAHGDALFGVNGGVQSHFLAAGYEMIVNQYFREEHDQYTIANDPAILPIVDRTAETQGDEDYEEEDETIDVSGGTLSIREIERRRARLAYERKVEAIDGKYTSWLRSQGVNANEAVAQIPEFLGHYRKYIKPQQTVNQTSGATVQMYKHECNFTLSKRRFFQEHGYVIGCYSMRPKIHIVGGEMADRYVWEHSSYFPHVGQLAENKKIQDSNFNSKGGFENETDGAPATYLNIDHYLWNGRVIAPNTESTAVNAYDPTDDQTALYPSAAWDSVKAGTETYDFVSDGVMSTKIATPLRRLRVV
jgi:hypothetical protein